MNAIRTRRHTHTHVSRSALAVATLAWLVPFAMTDVANGQVQYRLTWLTDTSSPQSLGFTPNVDLNGTMGINNKGQVCYGFKADDDEIHAWVWLPAYDAAIDMDAGWHDIGDLDGLDIPNIARDLNEGGKVVGISGVATDGLDGVDGGRVTVWTLGDPVDAVAYGTLGGTYPWSGGHAINDQTPIVVVGNTTIIRSCDCEDWESDPEGPVITGFRLILDGSPTLDELPRNVDDQGNAAFDVNTPSSGSARAVGWSDCLSYDPCGTPRTSDCSYILMDPMYWDGTTPTALDRIFTNRTTARGVNNAGQMVGFGRGDQGDPCDDGEQSHYWSASGVEFNLGTVMPSGQSGNKSRAEAINRLEYPRIVGWNVSVGHGLLWEKDGADPPGSGDFTATDVNDLIGCADWTITEAHDINDSNWIVGIASNSAPGMTGSYAVLLTPMPDCPVDINQSGCVDIDDELILAVAWYTQCEPGVICVADITGDCIVNIDDYLAIVNTWCGDLCPIAKCCESCPCEESFAGPGEGLTLEDAIEHILVADIPEYFQAIIIEQIIANWP